MSMRNKATALRKALEKFLFTDNEGLLGEDVYFYSQEEWKNRGEIYLLTSPFVMVIGSALWEILNYPTEKENVGFYSAFHAIVERHGYHAEQGNSWNIGFYPLG